MTSVRYCPLHVGHVCRDASNRFAIACFVFLSLGGRILPSWIGVLSVTLCCARRELVVFRGNLPVQLRPYFNLYVGIPISCPASTYLS